MNLNDWPFFAVSAILIALFVRLNDRAMLMELFWFWSDLTFLFIGGFGILAGICIFLLHWVVEGSPEWLKPLAIAVSSSVITAVYGRLRYGNWKWNEPSH